MKVVDVMTSPVVTVTPDDSVEDAVRLMLGRGISGLPVLDAEGALVGVVTEGDLLHRVECGTERKRAHWLDFLLGTARAAADYVHDHGRKVAELMTRNVLTVAEDTPLSDVVGLMEERHIKRLPVLRDGRLVGVVSRSDLLRALIRAADAIKGATSDDARIRAALLAEMEAQSWVPRSSLVVTIQDGVVDLRGVIYDDWQRKALRVMAENVPGVRRVSDNLVWVEPNSGMVIGAPESGG